MSFAPSHFSERASAEGNGLEFNPAEMDGLEFSSVENELEFGAVGQSPHAELEGEDDRGRNLALMVQHSVPMQVMLLMHISGV